MAEKSTRRVTFANNYTDRASGQVFVQGRTYSVPRPLARDLIARGKAREATASGEKTTSRSDNSGDKK